MRAESEEQIYNFEENIEKAFSEYFADKRIDLQDSSEMGVLPEDFIAVMVEVGAATGKAVRKPSNESEYSQYAFEVVFTIRTDRSGEESNNANIDRRQNELVSIARKWLSVSNARHEIGDYLDFYEINTLMPAGTERFVDDDSDTETARLTYSGQFDILSDAWPTS